MRSLKIPEFGKILQRLRIPISDKKSVGAVICAVFTVVSAALALTGALLPPSYLTALFITAAILLWNILFALSVSKQITEDQTSISKNRVLFRRFQNTTKYFESILQDTSDIIISLDKDYYIFKFNRGAESQFGYTQEEILGKPFEKLFTNHADKEKMQLPVKSGIKSANAEIPMKTKSGSQIIVNMCMSRMRDGGFVVTAQDITEKKRLEEQLRQQSEQLNLLAITDGLTGLFNCRHFYNVIKGELSRVKRHPDRKLSLLYMDVDKFKEYNDTEGHQMGDNVLKTLGDVITVCIRKDVDSGFRYGGDEFVVILPDTNTDQATRAAQRIQSQFDAYKFGNTSLSVGIAEAEADDDDTTLVRKADLAMYASKRAGKGCITVSGENLPTDAAVEILR